jgi:hypothetical protein
VSGAQDSASGLLTPHLVASVVKRGGAGSKASLAMPTPGHAGFAGVAAGFAAGATLVGASRWLLACEACKQGRNRSSPPGPWAPRGFKRAGDTTRPLFAAVLSFNKEDTKSLVTSL